MGRGTPDEVAFDKTWKDPCLTLGGWGGRFYPGILSVGPGPDSSLLRCPDGGLLDPLLAKVIKI